MKTNHDSTLRSSLLTHGLLATLVLALSGACVTPPELEHEPWSQIGKGTTYFGASSGWAFYGADVSAKGRSGVLAPGGVPDTGSDSVDLIPRYGFALKGSHFITDNIALGGIFEYRSFDPDTVQPLSAELAPAPFETMHFLLSSRYFFPPLEEHPRLKPFVGLDIGYIPDVKFDEILVTYPAATGIPRDKVSATGSEYWTIAPVVGGTFLWKDNVTIDFGTFYEFPLTESEDTVAFPNLGGSEATVRVEPEGLILFAGMSFYLL
jgi:hypothetical protein